MKKNLVLSAFLIWIFTHLLSVPVLNEFGHIVSNQSYETAVEYFFENNEYKIRVNDKILLGNSFYNTSEKFITLTTLEENVSTVLRIYDLNGLLEYKRSFDRVINFVISPDEKQIAFSNANIIKVLNLESLDIELKQGINVFAFDNDSNLIYYNEKTKQIFHNNISFSLNELPLHFEIWQNKPLVFTRTHIFNLNNETLENIYTFNGSYFDSALENGKLYVVERKSSETQIKYKLKQITAAKSTFELESKTIYRDQSRTHESIIAPLNYGEENYPFNMGNSYGVIQEFGNALYLHPGVDFVGAPNQEVYAVRDGIVKAVITTGGGAYWRVAVGNEDTPDIGEGYLYAHLNEASITVTVGDSVHTGDLLGTLFPWTVFDYNHCHFARIEDTGSVWSGAWLTTDNPLIDMTNVQDSIPPTFVDAVSGYPFAFRNEAGEYLDPFDLSGEFDIIVKCHDVCNSQWNSEIWDLRYALFEIDNPDEPIFEKFAYCFDMFTDTYTTNIYSLMALFTLYSRDDLCFSSSNYETREYYHIITNSNGDSLITEDDADEIFDSAAFPDGLYYLTVYARDSFMNETSAIMPVNFVNGVFSDEQEISKPKLRSSNYPNPFNPSTKISFELEQGITKDIELKIYNMRGQKVKTFSNLQMTDSSDQQIIWNGTDEKNKPVSSGIYYYRLKAGSQDITNKMLLIK